MDSPWADTVRHLARAADLAVPEDRLETLTTAFESWMQGLQALDQVDLNGVHPALVFSPLHGVRPGYRG